MNYKKIGNTDLNVSEICLGTMTWGQQNSELEGRQQLDYAKSNGINFIDTAEMYSAPTSEATYGATESIIGRWLNEKSVEINWSLLLRLPDQVTGYLTFEMAKLISIAALWSLR